MGNRKRKIPVIARMMLRIPAKLPHNNQETRSEPDHGSISRWSVLELFMATTARPSKKRQRTRWYR